MSTLAFNINFVLYVAASLEIQSNKVFCMILHRTCSKDNMPRPFWATRIVCTRHQVSYPFLFNLCSYTLIEQLYITLHRHTHKHTTACIPRCEAYNYSVVFVVLSYDSSVCLHSEVYTLMCECVCVCVCV